MLVKHKSIQWANLVEVTGLNLDKNGEFESVSVNLVLTEGTGEEEKVIKREDGFSFPLGSDAYVSLALTPAEIEELKNPPEVKEV